MNDRLDNRSLCWIPEFERWVTDCANLHEEFGNRTRLREEGSSPGGLSFVLDLRNIMSQMNLGYYLRQQLTTLRAQPEISASLEPYVERLEDQTSLLQFAMTAMVDRANAVADANSLRAEVVARL